MILSPPATGMMGPPTIGVVPLLPEPQLPGMSTNVPLPEMLLSPVVLPLKVTPSRVIVFPLDMFASSPTPELLLKVLQLILASPAVKMEAPKPLLLVAFPFAVMWSKEIRLPAAGSSTATPPPEQFPSVQ